MKRLHQILFFITTLYCQTCSSSQMPSSQHYTAKLVLHVRDSNGQVIDAADSALSLLKDEEVDAIIGPQKSAQSTFVIGLGDRANVPFISFSATSPSLHPQTPYFVQATIVDSIQVDAIVDIVKYFNWSQVVIINEESYYGNGINPYLSDAFHDTNTRVTYKSVIPLAATDDFMLQELYKMKTMQTRVFVVHISISLASKFFLKVKEAGMMSKGYAWIVTSGLMDLLYSLDSDVVESMEGVIGVKPLIPRSKRLKSTAKRWKIKFIHDNPNFLQAEFGLYGIWAYDALWALALAAEKVQFTEQIGSLQNTSFLNSTDRFTTNISKSGPKLQEALSEVSFEGLGGKFHLVNGQLKSSSFEILNVVGKGEREVGIWTRPEKSERNKNISSSLNIDLNSVMFPGDPTIVPKGWEIPVSGKKLRVGVPEAAGFPEFVRVEKDPQTNVPKVSGCYIDMFDAVMAELPYVVPYEYIPFGTLDDSSAGIYDELCHQVFLKNYDAAVGDFTITFKRSKYVDFTLPFVGGGITSMKMPKEANHEEWFFLRPFKRDLWLTTIALFIFTGLVLWILEHRFNDAYRGPPAQHTGMIFYFAFMSLAFAQRERIVSNLARFVVVVWMFVVLILTATYTAYLSARLTVENLELGVVSSPNPGDKVGCRKGSFIFDFLQEWGYDNITTYNSAAEVDKALGSRSISAFFSVKPYTDVFLSKYPNKYKETDKTHPTEGFAFVFEKGSPLVADVSRAVIKLTEKGILLKIKQHWKIEREVSNEQNSNDSSVVVASLKHFKALYGISGGIAATCLLVFIATYLYTNRDFVRRISNSSTTFWSKARAIGKHFDQRDPKSFRSSKYREDGVNASPSINENALSSRVVPILIMDSNEAYGDTSPNSEHTTPANHQTRSTDHIEMVAEV